MSRKLIKIEVERLGNGYSKEHRYYDDGEIDTRTRGPGLWPTLTDPDIQELAGRFLTDPANMTSFDRERIANGKLRKKGTGGIFETTATNLTHEFHEPLIDRRDKIMFLFLVGLTSTYPVAELLRWLLN